jgi:hypothetical protein
LIRFCLVSDLLEVDLLSDSRMSKNVVASARAQKLESKALDKIYHVGEPDIRRRNGKFPKQSAAVHFLIVF